MPFINSKVNVTLSKDEKEQLKSKLGTAISLIPGKSESRLMVNLEEGCSLYFKGDKEEKLAFVEVKLFGKASPSDYYRLTAEICKIYGEGFGIAGDKIYVKYEEVEHWGFNGRNF